MIVYDGQGKVIIGSMPASAWRWMTGDCGTYAIALRLLRPELRYGETGEIVIEDNYGEDDARQPAHWFAHDGRWAYDSMGRHPMPYFGWGKQLDYCREDVDLEDFWMVTRAADLFEAIHHATTHGIFAGGTIMNVVTGWQIMSPSGITGPTFTGRTAEEAARKAEDAGYEILDIQDRYLVIADDERG